MDSGRRRALVEADIELLVAVCSQVVPMEIVPQTGVVEEGSQRNEFFKSEISMALLVEVLHDPRHLCRDAVVIDDVAAEEIGIGRSGEVLFRPGRAEDYLTGFGQCGW